MSSDQIGKVLSHRIRVRCRHHNRRATPSLIRYLVLPTKYWQTVRDGRPTERPLLKSKESPHQWVSAEFSKILSREEAKMLQSAHRIIQSGIRIGISWREVKSTRVDRTSIAHSIHQVLSPFLSNPTPGPPFSLQVVLFSLLWTNVLDKSRPVFSMPPGAHRHRDGFFKGPSQWE